MGELTGNYKQCGNKIVEFKSGMVYGYTILGYKNYKPEKIVLVNTIQNPTDKVLSFDTAYDRLFGAPTKPDFSKVLVTSFNK